MVITVQEFRTSLLPFRNVPEGSSVARFLLSALEDGSD